MPKKLSPLAAAIIGVVTGVICVLLPSVATAIGQPLSEATHQGLELGGVAMLLGGVVGARFMPTKGEEPK